MNDQKSSARSRLASTILKAATAIWNQSPLYPKAIALRLISAAITAKKRITEILPERAEILRPFYLTKSLRGFKIELQKTNTKVEV